MENMKILIFYSEVIIFSLLFTIQNYKLVDQSIYECDEMKLPIFISEVSFHQIHVYIYIYIYIYIL